jgi:hypothetical protein
MKKSLPIESWRTADKEMVENEQDIKRQSVYPENEEL